MSATQEQPVPAAAPSVPGRLHRLADLTVRAVGGAVAVVAAVLTAVLELQFATVRLGGHLVGLSVLLAVVGNVLVSWFAIRAVGARWAVAVPAAAWFAVMVLAAGGTTEGDILLAGDNWVGFATIFAGAIAYAVIAFRAILSPRPAPGPDERS
ncbi:hypothetical protein O7623_26620 [Solwaraspora sp. WMMD791]|uniref:hypothetical protein n=1 Tax=Solwaraspora sp. WMMD791 TaxID=3016086 RepID=UPI00249CE99D|nr:hypothetical protein [Solwaraspora sp. WMMD791]WFE26809.1 hypothetical protein O7623_26620 [Solwaraspora sp. WMMD791]